MGPATGTTEGWDICTHFVSQDFRRSRQCQAWSLRTPFLSRTSWLRTHRPRHSVTCDLGITSEGFLQQIKYNLKVFEVLVSAVLTKPIGEIAFLIFIYGPFFWDSLNRTTNFLAMSFDYIDEIWLVVQSFFQGCSGKTGFRCLFRSDALLGTEWSVETCFPWFGLEHRSRSRAKGLPFWALTKQADSLLRPRMFFNLPPPPPSSSSIEAENRLFPE